MNQTVEIRLELLKKIGEGYSKAETVKYLVDNFGLSKQGAYYHFQTKDNWIDQYSAFNQDFAFQVRQRFNYIYREASFQYLHAKDDNARIGYFRTMLEANRQCAEYSPKGVDNHDDVTLKWQKPKLCLHAWMPFEEENFQKWLQENCTEEEQKALLIIKDSLSRFNQDTKGKGENHY